jgi:hypothetical protein
MPMLYPHCLASQRGLCRRRVHRAARNIHKSKHMLPLVLVTTAYIPPDAFYRRLYNDLLMAETYRVPPSLTGMQEDVWA